MYGGILIIRNTQNYGDSKNPCFLHLGICMWETERDESQKYRDFKENKFPQTMQNFLRKAEIVEEHFDRNFLVSCPWHLCDSHSKVG